MRWSLLERFLNGSCEPAELAEVEAGWHSPHLIAPR